MLNTDQIVAAQQANVETFFDLSHKAFAGVEKLVELNLATVRANLAESAETAKAALAAKDPQALMAIQAGLLQPGAEKLAAYGRHLYDITSSANAEAVKLAEAQMAVAQKSLHALVESAAKNAPAGTESGVALFKQAVEAANSAFSNIQAASKQAAEVAEANFKAVSETALKATKAAVKGKRAA